jgi:hypothetical protein
MDDKLEDGLAIRDSGSADDKAQIEQVDDVSKGAVLSSRSRSRRLEAPEFIRNMSPEEREAIELRLRRKIDLRLMPMIILMYILNYLDRNNIAAAKLAGILTDLHLKGVEFQVSPVL